MQSKENKDLIGDLLHKQGLKKTRVRTEILDVFMNNNFALSAGDVLRKMQPGNDRVTIYRALASFHKHGILHKASEDSQGVKYAICNAGCSEKEHHDLHAHFLCDECNRTYCLEDVTIPRVKETYEFTINQINYTLRGTCKECTPAR